MSKTTVFTTGSGCNNRKLSDEDRREVVRLYTTPLPDGTWMGVTAIARLFGLSHYAIQCNLKRDGVKLRSAKEAHAHGKRCKPVKNLPVGSPSKCKCGCGDLVAWNRRANDWNKYVVGHYTRRLEQSPSWEGGRSFEPYAPGWPEISRAIRERDRCCAECGSNRRLHVHHKDRDKLNNDPANLITLCNSCHSRTHVLERGGGA